MKRILVGLCVLTSLFSYAQNQIGPTGNVGIGTTSPQSKLHVANGDVLLQNTSGSGYSSLWAKSTDGLSTLQMDFNSIRITGSNGWIRTDQTLILNDIGGNVAIGTADAKGYKFAVNGQAIFEGVKVKLLPNWPDYVFKRDYQLLPLAELEKFIQQNSHLPGIPSAAEIEKNGLDLGAGQAALLKKIEELTLYIIEQNKKAEKQDEMIADMRKRLMSLESKIK